MAAVLAVPLLARSRWLRVVHVLQGEGEPLERIGRTGSPRIGGCGRLRSVLSLLADVFFRVEQRRDDETRSRHHGQQERSV